MKLDCFDIDIENKKSNKLIECKNGMIQKKMFSKCAIGISNVSGWGLFSRENIKKGDFIMEYIGEIVEEDETKERDKWNGIEEITYIFTLNNLVK